ncbi:MULTISPECIES: CPBP family intramembrane glutamic endopeptidase [unclassified Enterococcus]|jgi:membrane protease YdiL (CAAX protease family)|uniref:CPBP family intramembrane glutamic endopeptidase n=1 Tax=unclassified Enterococcus TaxID=2608891 RepID=UPI003D268A6A
MISKKKYDLDYPYTYGEKSEFDLFAWFKIFSIAILAFFTLSFFFGDVVDLLRDSFPTLIKKYTIEITIFSGILYLLMNLAGLEWAAKKNWKLLFKKLTFKDLKIVIGFTILTFLVSILIDGHLFQWIFGVNAKNPVVASDVTLTATITTLIEASFQVVGEEFVAIIPFLLVVSLGKRLHFSQTLTLAIAIVISSLIFGMAHTWTYGGLLQGIVAVFFSRIVMTMAYVKTKNLWVSYLVHYLFDSISFLLTFWAATHLHM